MRFLKNPLREKKSLFTQIFFPKAFKNERHRLENFHSNFLKRSVRIDLYLPLTFFHQTNQTFPVLFFNDGQDMEAVRMAEALQKSRTLKQQYLIAAIHAGDRMQEYGTANQVDYKKRGSKAKVYRQFIVKELLPFLQNRYQASQGKGVHAVAGFSLGGLSAFDLAWNQPEIFSSVGVFSGSLWW